MLQAGAGELETWRLITQWLCQQHNALVHEEQAQSSMMGVEKRLRDKEEEHINVLKWCKQMMEDHAQWVAQLNSKIAATKRETPPE